jgi:hypothetical protein
LEARILVPSFPHLLPEKLVVSIRSFEESIAAKLESQCTYTKDKLMSPCILAFNSSSRLRFKPTTNFTGFASFVFVFFVVAVAVGRCGRNGAAVSVMFEAKELLGFLLRRRRRAPEEDDPALDESSDSSSLRRRSSMMASFDVPFERSAGIVVVVGEASFAGIVIG